MPDTNKPPTLVAIGEGNVNKPLNTPDTEWVEAPEEIRSKCRAICGENDDEGIFLYRLKEIDTATDIAYQAGISSRDTYWLKHEQDMYESLDKEYQLQVEHAKEERDTYWKEREAKKDDLLDDMWGLICNVNGGIVEDEKPDWYEAFFRIREKYFKQITPINEDNLK